MSELTVFTFKGTIYIPCCVTFDIKGFAQDMSVCELRRQSCYHFPRNLSQNFLLDTLASINRLFFL